MVRERLHIDDADITDGGGPGYFGMDPWRLSSHCGHEAGAHATVDGTTVRTSSRTEVQRRGDVQTLDTLKVGQTVHVVGAGRPNGSIDARRIQIDDDQTGGEFEIHEAAGGLKGSCPALTFGVNGFSIDRQQRPRLRKPPRARP